MPPVLAGPSISEPIAREERTPRLSYRGPEMRGPTRTALQLQMDGAGASYRETARRRQSLSSPAARGLRSVSGHG